MPVGPDLLGCPREVQGLFSRMLPRVRSTTRCPGCYRWQGAKRKERDLSIAYATVLQEGRRARCPTLTSSGLVQLHTPIIVLSIFLPKEDVCSLQSSAVGKGTETVLFVSDL